MTLSSNAAQGKEPTESLQNPPAVTAGAWAIADGKTGAFLAGHEADKPSKIASTTKIMTAFVVLTLAEADPKVLEEVVTISKLADATEGSTADVKEGEKLTAGELLYGLLLPSGNDAANALAEHFSGRFKPLAPGDSNGDIKLPVKERANFVAEMNRTAIRLGMKKTNYYGAVGDGLADKDMTSTARDLLMVTHAAMQLPTFRKIVATKEYVGSALKPDGTKRQITWKNTNDLLGREGYDGVKTGTTTLAGRCVVISCHRDGSHLLVAVLGAATDPARYVDAQNLLRWAWLERKAEK